MEHAIRSIHTLCSLSCVYANVLELRMVNRFQCGFLRVEIQREVFHVKAIQHWFQLQHLRSTNSGYKIIGSFCFRELSARVREGVTIQNAHHQITLPGTKAPRTILQSTKFSLWGFSFPLNEIHKVCMVVTEIYQTKVDENRRWFLSRRRFFFKSLLSLALPDFSVYICLSNCIHSLTYIHTHTQLKLLKRSMLFPLKWIYMQVCRSY